MSLTNTQTPKTVTRDQILDTVCYFINDPRGKPSRDYVSTSDPQQLEITEDKCYIGSLSDIVDKEHLVDIKPGTWVIFDYYDHAYGLYGHHIDHPDPVLTYERTTSEHSYYGLMSPSVLKDFEDTYEQSGYEEVGECIENNRDIDKNGYICFGRGDEGFDLYMARSGGQVTSFLIPCEGLLD